jgi:hypothetical protein
VHPPARTKIPERPTLPGRGAPSGTVLPRRGVIQCDGWTIQQLLDAIGATSYGRQVLASLDQTGEKWQIVKGPRGQVFRDRDAKGNVNGLYIMISESLPFADAVQQAVQEISNATVFGQFLMLEQRAIAGKITEEQYVENIERGEYIGAEASFLVFYQAQEAGAAWAKDTQGRYRLREIESFSKYYKHLQDIGASKVYQDRYQDFRKPRHEVTVPDWDGRSMPREVLEHFQRTGTRDFLVNGMVLEIHRYAVDEAKGVDIGFRVRPRGG